LHQALGQATDRLAAAEASRQGARRVALGLGLLALAVPASRWGYWPPVWLLWPWPVCSGVESCACAARSAWPAPASGPACWRPTTPGLGRAPCGRRSWGWSRGRITWCACPTARGTRRAEAARSPPVLLAPPRAGHPAGAVQASFGQRPPHGVVVLARGRRATSPLRPRPGRIRALRGPAHARPPARRPRARQALAGRQVPRLRVPRPLLGRQALSSHRSIGTAKAGHCAQAGLRSPDPPCRSLLASSYPTERVCGRYAPTETGWPGERFDLARHATVVPGLSSAPSDGRPGSSRL